MTISHLEQEIERAKKAHAARMARLRRKAAAEQKRIDDKVVELLREADAVLYARLADEARDQLAALPKRGTRGIAKTAAMSETEPVAQSFTGSPINDGLAFANNVRPGESW